MSNQLTDFEAYIYHRSDTDASFDVSDVNCMIDLLNLCQESYLDEYQEMDELALNSIDVSEYYSCLKINSEVAHDLSIDALCDREREDKKQIGACIREYVEHSLKEAVYKLESQKEEVDGSYQAKQYAEIQRLG